MAYRVIWHEDAQEDLRRIPADTALKIIDRAVAHLAQDPIRLGKALTGPLAGLRRYRFGTYRLIYAVSHAEVLIIVVRVGHRRDVYK